VIPQGLLVGEQLVVHLPEFSLRTSGFCCFGSSQRMRVSPNHWEVTKDKAQIVAQKFLHFFDYGISASTVNALEVAILEQHHRRTLRALDVVAIGNRILESNSFCITHDDTSVLHITMNESSGTDPRTRGLDAEFDYCYDGQHNEKSQNNKLCGQEWRLGLRRSQRFQCWHFLEELHDQDENIEILSHHRGDNIDPAPGAVEVQHVTSEDRNSQYQQRDDANRNGRRKPMEGKEKPGNAGRYRARQKDHSPTVKSPSGKQANHDNKSRADSDQAYYDVHDSECIHDVGPFRISLVSKSKGPRAKGQDQRAKSKELSLKCHDIVYTEKCYDIVYNNMR